MLVPDDKLMAIIEIANEEQEQTLKADRATLAKEHKAKHKEDTSAINGLKVPVAPIKLTERERECIKWLIAGKTAEEIAIILNLSKRTIEMYIANAKRKFNCSKVTQLIYLFSKTYDDEGKAKS